MPPLSVPTVYHGDVRYGKSGDDQSWSVPPGSKACVNKSMRCAGSEVCRPTGMRYEDQQSNMSYAGSEASRPANEGRGSFLGSRVLPGFGPTVPTLWAATITPFLSRWTTPLDNVVPGR